MCGVYLFRFIDNNNSEACNFIKKDTLTQVFSCEFSEIFKNNFFHRTSPVVASACKCANTIGRKEKGKFFFRIPESRSNPGGVLSEKVLGL